MPATLAGMDLDDLTPFYADFAVDVIYTPQSGAPVRGRALFDRPGAVMVGGEMLATDYSVRYPVVTFQSVKRGDQFTIGGAQYIARENPQPAALDGLEFIVPLARSA